MLYKIEGIGVVAEFHVTNIGQACYYLNVRPDASEEMIKKAYREQCKRFHPDSNALSENSQMFILIRESYEFLLAYHKQLALKQLQMQKQSRVFASNINAKKQFEKQKQAEKDRDFVKQWEEKKRKEKFEQEEKRKHQQPTMTKEEELLQRIKAIWIAENIRRQVETEKAKIEQENKRKLYRAFMQQKMNENDELNL